MINTNHEALCPTIFSILLHTPSAIPTFSTRLFGQRHKIQAQQI